MMRLERSSLSKSETWDGRHLRKSVRPKFELPPKPGWQLLIEGAMLLVLGLIAVAAFAAMVFSITGLQ